VFVIGVRAEKNGTVPMAFGGNIRRGATSGGLPLDQKQKA
jgi:hypothetical protein